MISVVPTELCASTIINNQQIAKIKILIKNRIDHKKTYDFHFITKLKIGFYVLKFSSFTQQFKYINIRPFWEIL